MTKMLDKERLRQWWDALKQGEIDRKRITMADMTDVIKGQKLRVRNNGIKTRGPR